MWCEHQIKISIGMKNLVRRGKAIESARRRLGRRRGVGNRSRGRRSSKAEVLGRIWIRPKHLKNHRLQFRSTLITNLIDFLNIHILNWISKMTNGAKHWDRNWPITSSCKGYTKLRRRKCKIWGKFLFERRRNRVSAEFGPHGVRFPWRRRRCNCTRGN